MPDPNYILLYVDNPTLSADFYSEILGYPPVEKSPIFALFVLKSGVKLGLWARPDVKPEIAPTGGGAPASGEECELALSVTDDETVHALYDDWRARKMPILQPPTVLGFGLTFVAGDPDGHRLRVFALCDNPT